MVGEGERTRSGYVIESCIKPSLHNGGVEEDAVIDQLLGYLIGVAERVLPGEREGRLIGLLDSGKELLVLFGALSLSLGDSRLVANETSVARVCSRTLPGFFQELGSLLSSLITEAMIALNE
jgi:hypothetical protein